MDKRSEWQKRYVRLSEPFVFFFPIWFVICFFVGASLWIRFEAVLLTPPTL